MIVLFQKTTDLQSDHIFSGLGTDEEKSLFANASLDLLQLAGVDIGRGTHDVSKTDEEALRNEIHKRVFEMSRLGYAVLHCFPGVMELSIHKAFERLMVNSRTANYPVRFHVYEDQALWYMLQQLKVTEALRLFMDLTGRGKTTEKPYVNMKRASKLCFWYFLNPPESDPKGNPINIELWFVKYRRKLRYIFNHFWGNYAAGSIHRILRQKRWSAKDRECLETYINPYVLNPKNVKKIYECVAFALSDGDASDSYGKGYSLPLCIQHIASSSDLNLGLGLPVEILKGKWGQYHKDEVSKADFFKKAEQAMTQKEKFTHQQAARKAGVTIQAKASARSMKELWVYALSNEMTQEIEFSLRKKAEKIAKSLPFSYNNIGILVDDSYSSFGTDEQKNHPMASILAMRDILVMSAGERAVIRSASGRDYGMPAYHQPIGDTDLAMAFIDLVERQPEAIFVLSDGHDNVPSGRFEEVFNVVRAQGFHNPVYQCNPTTSAVLKTGTLSPSIPMLPVAIPEKFGVSLFTALMSVDPLRGLERYIAQAIENFHRKMEEFQEELKGGMLT